MSAAPFTASLRTAQTIELGASDAPRLTIRVQWLEGWDAIVVIAPASTTIVEVKAAAMHRLDAAGTPLGSYVVKHRGDEVLDEGMTLAAAGVADGGILSVSRRRRRAVR
jgi:hypothetical protein